MSQLYVQAPCENQEGFNCLEDTTSKRYGKMLLRPTRKNWNKHVQSAWRSMAQHGSAWLNMAQHGSMPCGARFSSLKPDLRLLECWRASALGHPDFATCHSAKTRTGNVIIVILQIVKYIYTFLLFILFISILSLWWPKNMQTAFLLPLCHPNLVCTLLSPWRRAIADMIDWVCPSA